MAVDDDAVDLGHRQADVEHGGQDGGPALGDAGKIDRIGDAGARRQQGGEAAAGGGTERQHREGGKAKRVGEDRRMAAAIGNHGQPVTVEPGAVSERRGQVPGRLDARRPVDAALGQRRVDDAVGTGERAGMAERGAAPRLRASGFHQHGRRRGGAGEIDQPAPVARGEALEIGEHDTGPGIRQRVLDQLHRADIDGVADGHLAAEAEAAFPRVLGEVQQQVAALQDQGDRPARDRVAAEVQVACRVEQADAVGSQQAAARGAVVRNHPRFDALAPRVDLAEARGDADDARNAALRAIGQGRGHRSGRHHEDGEVDRVGHVEDASIGSEAAQCGGPGVYGMDRAGEAVFDQAAIAPPAELGRILRRADEGDAARAEEGVEGAGHLGIVLFIAVMTAV